MVVSSINNKRTPSLILILKLWLQQILHIMYILAVPISIHKPIGPCFPHHLPIPYTTRLLGLIFYLSIIICAYVQCTAMIMIGCTDLETPDCIPYNVSFNIISNESIPLSECIIIWHIFEVKTELLKGISKVKWAINMCYAYLFLINIQSYDTS